MCMYMYIVIIIACTCASTVLCMNTKLILALYLVLRIYIWTYTVRLHVCMSNETGGSEWTAEQKTICFLVKGLCTCTWLWLVNTVPQILQNSTRRSLLRATMEGSKFTRAELERLYFWFEVCWPVHCSLWAVALGNTYMYAVQFTYRDVHVHVRMYYACTCTVHVYMCTCVHACLWPITIPQLQLFLLPTCIYVYMHIHVYVHVLVLVHIDRRVIGKHCFGDEATTSN